jgi:hypothetical protein
LAVSGIVACVVTASATNACGQSDETGAFQVVNDGASAVVVYQSGNTCRQLHDRVVREPGHATEFNATVGGPREDLLARNADRQLMGCLSMLIAKNPDCVVGTRSATASCIATGLSTLNKEDTAGMPCLHDRVPRRCARPPTPRRSWDAREPEGRQGPEEEVARGTCDVNRTRQRFFYRIF